MRTERRLEPKHWSANDRPVERQDLAQPAVGLRQVRSGTIGLLGETDECDAPTVSEGSNRNCMSNAFLRTVSIRAFE
jgi:hypothetical protein